MTEQIGLPHCRIHDFRHTVASVLFSADIPLKDIAVQLGHGQTSTTERLYVHTNNIANAQNIEVLSKAIGI